MRLLSATEKKTDVSELILDAAERLLKSYGYQKMTMTDLAAEAGIGVGTTYLHFASKSDVMVGVAERLHLNVLKRMQDIAYSAACPAEKLRQMLWLRIQDRYEKCREVLANISWQQFHRHGSEFVTEIKTPNPMRFEAWRQAEIDLLSKVISQGILEKTFLDVNPVTTAGTLLTATCGFMPRALDEEDFEYPILFKQRVEKVISLLVNGLVVQQTLSSH